MEVILLNIEMIKKTDDVMIYEKRSKWMSKKMSRDCITFMPGSVPTKSIFVIERKKSRI